jgi:hypothetical protein
MKNNFEDRLNAILPEVTSERFLKKKGLVGEIPFYVFDYPPDKELRMRKHLEFMEERIKSYHSEVKFIHIHLFELMIEHLQQRGTLDKCFNMEIEKGPGNLWKALSASVKPENFVKIMAQKYNFSGIDLVFISGIGTIWPWVRAHSLLNNLQSVTGDISVVLFYPGTYSGQAFNLFGKMNADNYYRAFRLVPE